MQTVPGVDASRDPEDRVLTNWATDWNREIDGAQVKLDELASAYADGSISMREWLVARAPIRP